jgi:hypothetical protein
VTGHPLDEYVHTADELPPSADADELWIVGDCDSLWLATGDNYDPWVAVEAGDLTFELTVSDDPDDAPSGTVGVVELMRFEGATDMPVIVERIGRSTHRVALDLGEDRFDTPWFRAPPGTTFRVAVRADPGRDRYVLVGPNFWSIPVLMRQWNEEWLSVPTLVVESSTAVRDGAEQGFDVEVIDGPAPTLCERLQTRL